MIPSKDKIDRQTIYDWLPLLVIVAGIVLNRLGGDSYGLVMYLGFISYGVFGLIEMFRRRKEIKLVGKILKGFALAMVIIIAIISILGDPTNFMALLALVLLDRIILRRLETAF
jgi:hypothetical protein